MSAISCPQSVPTSWPKPLPPACAHDKGTAALGARIPAKHEHAQQYQHAHACASSCGRRSKPRSALILTVVVYLHVCVYLCVGGWGVWGGG